MKTHNAHLIGFAIMLGIRTAVYPQYYINAYGLIEYHNIMSILRLYCSYINFRDVEINKNEKVQSLPHINF